MKKLLVAQYDLGNPSGGQGLHGVKIFQKEKGDLNDKLMNNLHLTELEEKAVTIFIKMLGFSLPWSVEG